ncbi:MAG: hypothetical protein JWO11_1135 [Nocardioides sp.]|nr:hypothetical protein [Nocardioides sp.]
MRRLLPLGTAVAVTAASLIFAGPTVAATPDVPSGDSAAKAKVVATRFYLRGVGYGTRIEGGQLPVTSGTTGFQGLGCTNKAGLNRTNYEASATVPGLALIEGVKTRTWSRTRPAANEVSVNSLHNVAKVVLGGQLTITGVNSFSKAWHDRKGFHTKTSTSIAGISVAGQTFPIPTPGQPLVIPGLARIAIGEHKERHDKDGAYASANAVHVTLIATDTQVRISHSASMMGGGITYGRFHGHSNGTQVRALDDNVKSGPTPLSYMGCQGTKGEVKTKSVAGIDLAGQLVVGAVENQQMGKQTQAKTFGFEQSKIATINLGGGQLVINAITARANVTRLPNGKLLADANGTTIGEIVVNGSPQAIPDIGQAIEIPGLLKLEANVIDKTAKGIDVVAIRITLLDGTGAVIDLAHAHLDIKPSGRIMN